MYLEEAEGNSREFFACFGQWNGFVVVVSIAWSVRPRDHHAR
jgi:hypothetical protein